MAAAGHVVDASLKNSYTRYVADQKSKRPKPLPFFPLAPIPEMPVETDSLQRAVNDADVALITLGRNSGEFSDRKLENDFLLSVTEQALIKNIADALSCEGEEGDRGAERGWRN